MSDQTISNTSSLLDSVIKTLTTKGMADQPVRAVLKMYQIPRFENAKILPDFSSKKMNF